MIQHTRWPLPQGQPVRAVLLFETRGRFYITGSDQPGATNRVLKIDKNLDDDGQLMITEDATIYTNTELKALIEQLSMGNAASGGLTRPIEPFWGIVGFIKFTGPYYLVTIKTRIPVAMVGGHYIYHSEETQLTPVTGKVAKNQQVEEARLMAAFKSVDLSKNFYFSYSYDITNTLQSYFIHTTSHSASLSAFPPDLRGHLLITTTWNLKDSTEDDIDKEGGSPWVLPLIYGFVDQSKLNVFGRTVYVAVIARRSRHFAGARFLKRGVSEDMYLGYVANEVEIEQIVTDGITTALHLPDPENREDFDSRKPNPRYTSYVQLRGSIPLLWNQDTTITKAKPPIEFSIIDPYFSGLLSTSMTSSHLLEWRAEEVIEKTKFFHSGPDPNYKLFQSEEAVFNDDGEPEESGETQNQSIDLPLRYKLAVPPNCIDCIESAFSSSSEEWHNSNECGSICVGKAALAHQLHALGIIKSKVAPYDSDAVDILTNMYHDLGDTIALQYGVLTWSPESDSASEKYIQFKQINPSKRSYTQWFHPDHLIKPSQDPETITKHLSEVSRRRGNDDTSYATIALGSDEYRESSRKEDEQLTTMVYTSTKAMEANLSPFKRRRGVNEIVERQPRHSAERTPHGVGVSVGVRRWLKTKSNLTLKSNPSTIKGIGTSKGRSKGQLGQEPRIPPMITHQGSLGLKLHDDQASSVVGGTGNETKRLAIKLLQPNVDAEEAKEYISYLHQFDKLKLYSTSARNDIHEADLKVYEKSVAICSPDPSEGYYPTSTIQVGENNRLLYEEAVMIATMSTLD
ncbi:hypothetical protein H4Q26_002895 [Puccinia striiformis f. sp. tritici PST-130]|nr:hypothetical protein H4Q26_002895 [Puccinia striiformis f. sp. tritici PST-130]